VPGTWIPREPEGGREPWGRREGDRAERRRIRKRGIEVRSTSFDLGWAQGRVHSRGAPDCRAAVREERLSLKGSATAAATNVAPFRSAAFTATNPMPAA